MPDEPQRQAPVNDLLPDRGGPSVCTACQARFPTRFALTKHTYQGCPSKA